MMRARQPIWPLLLLAGLGGCASQIPPLRVWADQSVGRNVAELRDLAEPPGSYTTRHGGQKRTYTLANGHWVYVHPDRPNCEVHFEVDNDDIVVGYTLHGRGCVHQ